MNIVIYAQQKMKVTPLVTIQCLQYSIVQALYIKTTRQASEVYSTSTDS